MPELVALQVERALMIVTARDRVVAGEEKREPWSSIVAFWSVETTVCRDSGVSASYMRNLCMVVDLHHANRWLFLLFVTDFIR